MLLKRAASDFERNNGIMPPPLSGRGKVDASMQGPSAYIDIFFT